MNFVLNASRLATWDFATVAARAAEARFDGVELGASTNDGEFTSTNVLLSDPGKVREAFDSAGVHIVTLASGIDERAESFAEQMTAILDTGQKLGATLVRMPWHSDRSAKRIGEQLIRAADDAARRNIRIALENGPTTASAGEIWTVLEQLEHPALGCSLNLQNLTRAGQSPYQTVPTLNQKIFYAEVVNGDLPVREFLTRLLGIGYGGHVAVNLREGVSAEENARDGLTRMREWAQPHEATQPAGRRIKSKAR